MAGVIKIESFDVDVATVASTTHNLTTDVGSLNSAFVRRTTSIDKQSGPTGSTGNANANIACGAAYLSATNQISFRQDTTTSQKIVGEVWRYTGLVGGADEFIIRGRYTITLASTTSGSVATSGIVDRNKCIPFWTGATQTAASVNDYDASTVSVYIDASGNIQVERGSGTGTLVVYVTVVEFTGGSWSVGHVKSANHDGANETDITINTDSTGAGGSTFDVDDWSKATLIEGSLEGDTSETGLSDNLGCWVPGSSTTTASFYNDQDWGTQNDGVAYGHILAHPNIGVYRDENTNYGEGNGTYTAVPFPTGAPTTVSLDELSIEWYSDTSGTGAAHARGRLSTYITSSNTITTWVHRSGNNVRIDYGVIDLSGVYGVAKPNIYDVSIEGIGAAGATNVIVTGANFGTNTLLADIEISNNPVYGSGIVVSQSVDSWADTSIQFDTVLTGIALDQPVYIWVTASDGLTSSSFILFYGNPTMEQIVTTLLSTAPDHYWTMDSLSDVIGGSGYDLTIRTGSPSLIAYPLMRGSTNSGYLSASGQGWRSNDSLAMNITNAHHARTVIWAIRILETNKAIACIDEEGGSANNRLMILAPGNVLTMQLADTEDDNVHAYSDFKLKNNRTYLVAYSYDYDAGVKTFKNIIDGTEQADSFGNPLTATDLDSYSGDISVGTPETANEVFGTDVTFPNVFPIYLAHKMSFTVEIPASEIKSLMIDKGAIADITIVSGTQAVMQAALEVYNDTERPDAMCCIDIESCTDGDFTLSADNISFEDGSTIQVRYLGADVLTWINTNGSNASITVTPYGGTVNILNTIPTTIQGIPTGVEWRLYEKGIGNQFGIELAGEESKVNADDIIYSDEYSSDTEVVLQVLAGGFEEFQLSFSLLSTAQTQIVELQIDNNI